MQRRQRHDAETTRRRVPRALRAEDREAVRGGVRPRRRRVAARVRLEPRHRLPDRRRHPRLHRADDRDRQGRRHRPARRHADAAADPRRAGGRGRAPRARRRAAGGALVRVAETRRARALARGRARLRGAGARVAERDAPEGARRAASPPSSSAELTHAMIRLGRISYVNMAPVFFRLDAEVDEVQGVPTALNRAAARGRARHRADLVDRVRAARRPAAHPAAALRLVAKARSTRSSSCRRRRSSTCARSP